VQVTTLNELIVPGKAPFPNMVKIDAEGFDLKVLARASNLLGKTDIFLVEAMVCGPYENSALEVMQFMAGARYCLIDYRTGTQPKARRPLTLRAGIPAKGIAAARQSRLLRVNFVPPASCQRLERRGRESKSLLFNASHPHPTFRFPGYVLKCLPPAIHADTLWFGPDCRTLFLPGIINDLCDFCIPDGLTGRTAPGFHPAAAFFVFIHLRTAQFATPFF
jgi:hypothetical protein